MIAARQSGRLTLLVHPLYGGQQTIGIRELLQNALDAVRERQFWAKTHNVRDDKHKLFGVDCDVLLELREKDDGKWVFVVADRGIGMTQDVLRNYFLRAGASYRNSDRWASEFADDKGHSYVFRSGRFGVGVFAAFLLGARIHVNTRHVQDDNEYELLATRNIDDHCCPVKSRIESIGWGHRGIRFGSRMAGVPVKRAFFRIA